MAHSEILTNRINGVFILLLICSLTINTNAQSVSDPVPDFALESVNGGTFTLSDHLGKVVLIYFFGNTCPYCISAGPDVQSKLVDDFSSYDDFVVVGIDAWNGSKTQVNGFGINAKVNFELLMNGSSTATNLGTQYDRLVIVDREGNFAYKGTSRAQNDIDNAVDALINTIDIVMGVHDNFKEQEVLYNYPNPVINQTNIHYKNIKAGSILISVHDITGKMVKEVYNGHLEPGNYDFPFNKESNPSGIYFYKVTKNNLQGQVKRLIIK